jgi:lipopolysaccharide export LptBFGC system permease protein LptF
MKIITKYIVKEIVPNFFLGLIFFSLIMIIMEIFKLVAYHVEKNVPIADVAKLFIYTLPYTFALTIPIGVLVGTLLAISRLSADSEVVAMRANGISLLKIFVPTFIFGLIISVAHISFFQYVLPWGNRNYVITRIQIFKKNPTVELSENNSFTQGNISIQADGVNPDTRELEIVRITDTSRDGHILYAQRGEFLDKDYERNAYPLKLYNVSIYPSYHTRSERNKDNTFEEKYNEEVTLYIEDQVDTGIEPQGSKIDSITELYEKINIYYAGKDCSYYTNVNNYMDYLMIREFDIRRKNEIEEQYPNIQELAGDDLDNETYRTQLMREAQRRAPASGESIDQNATRVDKSKETEEADQDDETDASRESGKDHQSDSSQIEFNPDFFQTSNSKASDESLNKEMAEIVQEYKSLNREIKQYGASINSTKNKFQKLETPEDNMLVKERVYEFTKKFSIPLACLAFTLIGAPLGIFSKRSGKTQGLFYSFIIVFIWYGLLLVGDVARKKDAMDPITAAILMDVVIIIAGIYFIFNRIKA